MATLTSTQVLRFGSSRSLVRPMLLMLLSLLGMMTFLLVDSSAVYYNTNRRPQSVTTHRPVIGVLTLPEPNCLEHGNQVIVTSNARWLQAGGARVVPIFYDSTPEELERVLSRVNGVFWTGGTVSFNPHIDDRQGPLYLRATEYILQHVIRENRKGNFYPLWGTCLGFERLLQLIAQDKEGKIVEEFDAENFAINLGFTEAAWGSGLFSKMSDDLFKEVASPVGRLAFNNHGLGISPASFRNNTELTKHLTILSIDHDRNGKAFVSTVEGKGMPIYGSQWHPEKAPWEWNPTWEIARTGNAIRLSSFLGRFFVNECKYNPNRFEDEDAIEKLLLQNWVSRPASAFRRLDPSVEFMFSEVYCFHSKQPPAQTFQSRRGAKKLTPSPSSRSKLGSMYDLLVWTRAVPSQHVAPEPRNYESL